MKEIFKSSDSFNVRFMKAATVDRASTLTKKSMHTTFATLEKCAKINRWGNDVNPKTITQKQLTKFVKERLDDGISARSIQNQMSHIRRALHTVGRSDFADSTCSNKELGVPSGTRIGSGKVVDPEIYAGAVTAAAPDTRAWIEAMKELGLRQRELVRAGPSLQQWERQLEKGQPITLHDGSKGGRSRQICIPPERRDSALAAVRDLKEVAEAQGGRVVDSATLESACKQVGDRLAAVGLAGKNAGHSLRRDFAMQQYKHYTREGFSEKEALAMTSADLGHGDGRGRWVYNNYIRSTLGAEA
jgi:site-specific recombinase XerC